MKRPSSPRRGDVSHGSHRGALPCGARCPGRTHGRHGRGSRRASRDTGFNRRGGFTLVEVLVALGILLFGMTAVLGLLTFGAALSRTALLRTTAASAAEAVVADLEERMFPLVDGEAGEPVDVVGRELGAGEIVYTARAVENPARPLEYRVDVEMTWNSAGVRREKRFRTLLYREIPFGERLRRQFVEKSPGGAPEKKIEGSAPRSASETGVEPATQKEPKQR